jgi:hypothetical protein
MVDTCVNGSRGSLRVAAVLFEYSINSLSYTDS